MMLSYSLFWVVPPETEKQYNSVPSEARIAKAVDATLATGWTERLTLARHY